jgi:hypothetical protein
MNRWRIGVVILLLAIFGPVIAAGNARAQVPGARFVYELCDPALPGGNPPEFDFQSQAAYAPFQTCASPGGTVGVDQTGAVSQSAGLLTVGVLYTPGGFVESETITAFASNLQPGAEGSHVATDGWPPDNGGDQPRFFFEHSERIPLSSGGGFTVALDCSGTCQPGGVIGAHYIAATEVDPTPPVVGKIEGTLLSGGVLRGHQSVSSQGYDQGGGVSMVDVVVNGSIAPGAAKGSCAVASVSNPSYRGLVAYSVTPCPELLKASWDLNTAEYPFHEGLNTVQVCVSDFATIGPPNTTCSSLQTVDVNNSCTESLVAGGQNLTASFQGVTGEAVTVPFEQAAEVTGELTSNAGDPISGATICVQAQVQESAAEPQTVATATTDANGNFNYAVPPGPNRRLLVGYRHDAFQVAKTLTFNSHAKPTIELSRGRISHGGRIKITGSLPGPGAAGRVVVLQAASLHGSRWLTFRRATTGPQGGFRSGYRFGSTSSTTTYRIRAVVPRQAGYPYEPGHSTPKRIKVLGPGAGKKKAKTKKHTHGGRGR